MDTSRIGWVFNVFNVLLHVLKFFVITMKQHWPYKLSLENVLLPVSIPPNKENQGTMSETTFFLFINTTNINVDKSRSDSEHIQIPYIMHTTM